MPLSSAAVTALEQLLGGEDATGWVFLNSQGERLTGPRYWFEPAIREAKIQDFHWHDLRHTFASRLTMAGIDLRTVQELMGHKTIAMTCRYAHLAPTHQLAAVERLAEVNRAIGSRKPEPQTVRPTDTRIGINDFGAAAEELKRATQVVIM